MDLVVWLVSSIAAVAVLVLFAGLSAYAFILRRRALARPAPHADELVRRRATESGLLGMVAGVLGLAFQLSFSSFYACSLIGHTVRGEIVRVKRTVRGSYHGYTAEAVYV
jgi:hypothetical protein